MLQPIAVDLKSLSDALADAQSIAIGFTQASKNPDKEENPEYNFPSHLKLIKKLEETFEIDLRDELAFFAATGKAG